MPNKKIIIVVIAAMFCVSAVYAQKNAESTDKIPISEMSIMERRYLYRISKNKGENAYKIPAALTYNCDEMPILDSIKYITMAPWHDENYPDYYYGDSICKRIIFKHGTEIIPCLIERIKDTTISKVVHFISDDTDEYVYYTVSDVVIRLLFDVILEKHKTPIDIKGLAMDLFYKDFGGDCNDYAERKLDNIFIWNDPEKDRYRNRIKFYNRVKKWYEEEMYIWEYDYSKCKR